MAPAPIILDTSDDLSFAPPAQPAMSQRNLILAPPSVSSHPEQLEAVFATYDRASSDLQMLDRLSAGLISLPAATYDLVLILTGATGERRSEALSLLGRQPFTAIVTSMKSGALFKLQDGPLSGAEAREAILAGLVQKDGSFEKAAEEAVAVPLKLGKKKTTVNKPVQINLDDIDGDDDLIDEEELLTADDRNKIVQRTSGHNEFSPYKLDANIALQLPSADLPPVVVAEPARTVLVDWQNAWPARTVSARTRPRPTSMP